MSKLVFTRAQDAYATLCSFYGHVNADVLMKVRGACVPSVARLAKAMGRSHAALIAVSNYRLLPCIAGGYKKLMTACSNDGAVKLVIDKAERGRHFSSWEIDTAIQVLLAVIDARNGVK